jgi:glycosyltransferase involved in cell wall biosynthesis
MPLHRQDDMKAYPKISIVTPSFNQALFLEGTIKSVLDQGYPDLEYIIIDGGSTDDSVNIIKKFQAGISYWVSEKDSGQTEAINKGLKRVSGDIWAYICSDDTYTPNAFAMCVRAFEDSEVDVVYGDCNFINEDDIVTRIKKPGPFSRKKLLRGNYLYQPSVFMRKWILDDVGPFTPSLQYAMDYEYWLRLSDRVKFRYVSYPFSNYRLHTASKSMHAFVNQVEEATIVKKQYGAGVHADWTNFTFKLWGRHYYQWKRRFFDYLATRKTLR